MPPIIHILTPYCLTKSGVKVVAQRDIHMLPWAML
jgi:hypothetical protein